MSLQIPESISIRFTPILENGNTSIQLRDVETNELLANITSSYAPKWGAEYINIHDTPDNQSVIKMLISWGVIYDNVINMTQINGVSVSTYELTSKADELRKMQYNKNFYDILFNINP